jgi:hypothetical protein
MLAVRKLRACRMQVESLSLHHNAYAIFAIMNNRIIMSVLLFLVILLILPLPVRSLTYDSPDCTRVDCRLIGIAQQTQISYFPGFVALIQQAQESRVSGENFWHGRNDSDDRGLRKSEVLRNAILALLLSTVISLYILPKFRSRSRGGSKD